MIFYMKRLKKYLISTFGWNYCSSMAGAA